MLAVAAVLTAALGCSRSAAPTPPSANESDRIDEIQQEILLSGFDPLGEPVIRVMADGSVQVVFNFMPPSYVPDELGLGPFADFDKQLEQAVGVPVLWDDRECSSSSSPSRIPSRVCGRSSKATVASKVD